MPLAMKYYVLCTSKVETDGRKKIEIATSTYPHKTLSDWEKVKVKSSLAKHVSASLKNGGMLGFHTQIQKEQTVATLTD